MSTSFQTLFKPTFLSIFDRFWVQNGPPEKFQNQHKFTKNGPRRHKRNNFISEPRQNLPRGLKNPLRIPLGAVLDFIFLVFSGARLHKTKKGVAWTPLVVNKRCKQKRVSHERPGLNHKHMDALAKSQEQFFCFI